MLVQAARRIREDTIPVQQSVERRADCTWEFQGLSLRVGLIMALFTLQPVDEFLTAILSADLAERGGRREEGGSEMCGEYYGGQEIQ